jgi:hypothetical protein
MIGSDFCSDFWSGDIEHFFPGYCAHVAALLQWQFLKLHTIALQSLAVALSGGKVAVVRESHKLFF